MMRLLFPKACGAAILLLSLTGRGAPVVFGQAAPADFARTLASDLEAIPSGSPPTAAQIDALSADLGALFADIPLPPTVTIDYAAGLLADAAAHGQFAAKDRQKVASAVAQILTPVPFFDATKVTRLAELANLAAELTRAGVAPSTVQPLTTALASLPSAFVVDSYLNYVQVSLQKAGATKGYRHAFVNATLNLQLDDHDHPTRDLGVNVYRVPYGTYRVSVTTASSGEPVPIGTFRVTARDLVPLFDLSPPTVTQASGSFGDSTPKKPLPAGLSLDDLTGITVTDDQGVQQFTGSFANFDYVTRERRLHLLATSAAPTAGGTLVATSGLSAQGSSGHGFEFVAIGLPTDATLTLSINGAAVQTVTTGPTGDLYIRGYDSEFIGNPPRTDPVNTLSNAVDLFTATAFVVSDASGHVLLSASAAR